METIRRKRLQTDYEPLSLSVSMQVATANSGPGQVYDPTEDSYAPDREITPMVIIPIVRANTIDGSWTQHVVNPILSEIKWFVNGINIANVSEWNGKYTIENEGLNKGSITVEKNISVEDIVELHFEALVPDNRTGVNVLITSDTINLTTVDKAGDTWGVGIDVEPDIVYNPFLDNLLLFDYKTANGISAGNRNDAIDTNAYEREVNVYVTFGGNKATEGFTTHLYKLSGQSMTEITNELEIKKVSNTKIALDIRFIEKADYMIIIKSEDAEVARTQFSVTRYYPEIEMEILSGVSIRPKQRLYLNQLSISHNSNVVEYPARLVRTLWYTDTENIVGKEWQEGNRCVVEILHTGIGRSYLDSWMDLYVKADIKKAFDVYDDYTDKNGNNYIGN